MSSIAMGVEVRILAANAVDRGALYEIDLLWTAADPLAVALDFGDGQPTWVVSRDLLAAGLAGEPCGLADVSVIPHPGGRDVEIVMCVPAGRCSVVVDVIDLDAFLSATVHRCPLGAEDFVPDTPAELNGAP